MNNDLQHLSTHELAQMVRELQATNRQLQASAEALETEGASQFARDSQLRQSSLLTQLAIGLRETLNPQTIVEQVLRVLANNLAMHSASVILVSPDGKLELASSVQGGVVQQMNSAQARSVMDRGLAGWVMRHGSSVALVDIAQDQRWLQFNKQAPQGSAIVQPIWHAQARLGVLCVQRGTTNAFTSHDLLLLEAAAAQVGVALGAAQHYRNERRRRDQALALLAMSQFLTAERSSAELAAMLHEKSVAVFGGDYGLLFLTNDRLVPPKPVALPAPLDQDTAAGFVQRATAAADEAWQLRQIITDPATSDDELTCVAVPLVHNGYGIGAFVLARSAREEVSFSTDLWSLISIFAHVIAAACANVQLVARLKDYNAELEALISQRTYQVQHSRDALRVIFDSMADGVLLLDAAEQLRAANNSFCHNLIGRHPRELVGQSYGAILQLLEQRGELRIDAQSQDPKAQRGASRVQRVQCSDASGQQRCYSVERTPVPGTDGQVEQYLEFWRSE